MLMDSYDIIIVGSGISGLSLGYFCAEEGLRTVLLEKEARIGGAFHSHSSGEDFWIELGAHTCYNSYGNLLSIIEGCGISGELRPREKVPFKILSGETIRSIPSQIRFPELLFSISRLFFLNKRGESVESYYGRIVGKKNYERVFRHLFNSVLSQETGPFPADLLFKKRPRRKDILKSFTLSRGVQAITDAIATQEGLILHTGVGDLTIDVRGDHFRVTQKDGPTWTSRFLALAVPASVAAGLLGEAYPSVSRELARIEMAAVESMGVIVEKESINLPLFAGVVAPADSFYSIVSRDTLPHEHYRGFTFHFKPELLDRDAKIERIIQVLKVPRERLIAVVEKRNLLPALRVGHEERIRDLDRTIEKTPLFLTGNYFGGVAIEDCVSRSLREFQRLRNSL